MEELATYTPPKRQRLIDICMEQADKDVRDGVIHATRECEKDDTDKFLDGIATAKDELEFGVVHVPDFYYKILDSNLGDEEKYNRLMNADYLTDSFLNEIESRFPNSSADATTDSMNSETCNDLCMTSCNLLFPVGRVFINYKQLFQAVKVFGQGWSFIPCIQSSSIRCHYSKTVSAPKKHEDIQKQRTTVPSLKEAINCAFEIRFSMINHIKRHKKPIIFYRVHITYVNALHNCSLSKEFMKKAEHCTRGRQKYDLKRTFINCVISL